MGIDRPNDHCPAVVAGLDEWMRHRDFNRLEVISVTAAEWQATDAYNLQSGRMPVNWGRKSALFMLAVVVLWTAMPAAACLLGMQQAGRPDCCKQMEMGPDCCSPVMGASGACCQIQGQNFIVSPAQPYSPEHSQRLVSMPHATALEESGRSRIAYRNASKAPPPKFPPGGAFALRI